MAWTYSGDPSASLKDAVRVTIGDTVEASPLLQDEEIAYFLTAASDSILLASIAAAEAISARFARLSDEVTGDLQRKCSQKYKQYKDLADKLREVANDPLSVAPTPFGGGISRDDMKTRRSDADRYPDIFNIGETDNHRGLGIKGQEGLEEGRFFTGDD